MSKYDCEKTRDFIHEWKRYSLSRDGRKDVQENTPVNTWDDDAIERIQKWSDEHPEAPKLTPEERAFVAAFKIKESKRIERRHGKQTYPIASFTEKEYSAIRRYEGICEMVGQMKDQGIRARIESVKLAGQEYPWEVRVVIER